MSTNYTTYSGHANATITVSTTAELDAALTSLSAGGGGTILLDGNGGPYDIHANGIGDVNNPILIKAADPNNEPLVQNIYLQNSSYITMTELDVNSVGTGSTVHDLRVSNSDHIEFVDNSMTSNANGMLDGTGGAIKGGNAVLVRDSQDIVFTNNTITDYNMGATFLETVGLDFSSNEITGIQGDGFRAGGLQNAVIDNNYMHDFYGSLQTINHSDFIQIWSVNANLVTTNIEISNNILDSNGGSSAQGIFIGNEGTRNGANGPQYQDIRIHDNIVHTASYHGISIEGTQGVQLFDNTVLWDDQAGVQTDASSPAVSNEPFIRVTNSAGAVVYGNIAGNVSVNGVRDTGINNQILDFSDPATTLYFDNFMASLPTWTMTGGGGSTSGGSTSGGSTGGSTGGGTTDTSGGSGTDTGSGGTDTSGGSTDTSGDDTDTSGDTDTTGGSTDTGGSGDGGDTDTGGENDGGDGSDDDSENGNGGGGPSDVAMARVSALMQKSVSNLLAKFTSPNDSAGPSSNSASTQPTVTIDAILETLTVPETEDPLAEDPGVDEDLLELV